MKANALMLWKHFSKNIEEPKGADSQERALVRSFAIKAKKDLVNRFKTAKKYKDDPEIKELIKSEGEKEVGKSKGRDKSA